MTVASAFDKAIFEVRHLIKPDTSSTELLHLLSQFWDDSIDGDQASSQDLFSFFEPFIYTQVLQA